MFDPFIPPEHIKMHTETTTENTTESTTEKPDVQASNAQYFLHCALYALQERAAIRDRPDGERSAERAAAILMAWTGQAWTASDVWRCLLAVKQAREIQGAFHSDDYTDGAGYFALLGEHEARLNRA